MQRPVRKKRLPLRFQDYEMASKESTGDKKSFRSVRSTLIRQDYELRLTNQDELVKASNSSIQLMQSLLENTVEENERCKLVKEILQETSDVKNALRLKEEILKEMPQREDDEVSSLDSQEKRSNVSRYIQNLKLDDISKQISSEQNQPNELKSESNKCNAQQAQQFLQATSVMNEANSRQYQQVNSARHNERPASPVMQHEADHRRGAGPSYQDARRERYPSSMDIMLMRDQLQSLRSFSGEPREWQSFQASYNETKFMLSDVANMNRLRKAIIGKAAVAVGDMLAFGMNPEGVMTALSKLYGNPRMIINELFERVENAAHVKESKLETVVNLACIVRNLCAALQNLGGTSMHHDHSLICKLELKLSQSLLLEWGRYKLIYQVQWPSVSQFSKFIDFHADVAQEVLLKPMSKEPESPNQPVQRRRAQTVLVHEERKDRGGLSCYYCKEAHSMRNCEKFSKLNLEGRRKWVKDELRCFICLGKHLAKECKWKDDVKRRCGQNGCEKKHWRLLHLEPKQMEATAEEAPETNLHTRLKHKEQVLFRVVPVRLYGANHRVVSTFAFIDDGSTISMMDKELADELCLDGEAADLCLRWTGDTTKCEKSSKRVNVSISGVGINHKQFMMHNVRTVQNLALPQQSIDAVKLKSKYKFLEDVEFQSMNGAVPRILIGLSHNKLGLPSEIRQGSWNEPVAANTRLGWIVFGLHKQAQITENFSLHVCECEDEGDSRLDELYENYLRTEEASIKQADTSKESLEDKRAKAILADTMVKNGARYEVGLLWRNEMQLPDSKLMAKRRLECVERKCARSHGMLEAYNLKIDEYLQKGYARRLNDVEKRATSTRMWYIPHFMVFNPNKPNKQRLVFDAAAKVNEVSLNDALLVGPDLYCSLPGVLSKFREGAIAVASDIVEMFHRVNVRPEDQTAQRFLWRNGRVGDEPEEFAMVALPFGLACSPSIAQYVKNANAQQFAEKHPRAVEAIIKRHYVDDLLDSFETQEEAIRVCKEITEIQKSAGFELHGWTSNNKEVAGVLNQSPHEEDDTRSLDVNQQNEKVLGLYWDTRSDALKFKLSFHKVDREILEGTRAPTKRELLRTMMSVFDPQGMLSNVMFFVKAIFQDACRLKIDWDQVLEVGLLERWKIWLAVLPSIENISIPRNYSAHMFTRPVELHILTDASELAYAAVAYFVIRGEVTNEVKLVAAKSKVGPTKQRMTIPRMELMGALTGARLAARIENDHSIKITARVFWCDNKSVLQWIRGGETWQLKPFVACRVLEILELTKSKEWMYVPSKQNVADDATKWLGEPDFKNESRWFSGPEFLRGQPESWPVERREESNEDDSNEIKIVLMTQEEVADTNVVEPERFSSWHSMRKAMAQALRAIKKMQKKPVEELISVVEYQEARRVLIKQAQAEVYHAEIDSLKKNSLAKIPTSSELRILSPYLDDQGILRMSGRIDKASCVNDWSKRPIILPSKHKITEQIVADYHETYQHGNNETVINQLRARYVIPKMRAVVRRVASACQECHVNKVKPRIPEEGLLPSSRLSPHEPPFTHTGVDYFGPLEVTVGRKREKRWVALFTCLTFRAVHLEIASDLSADAFIRCLKRFISRRRVPKFMYSDNGTNFKGAARELQEAIKDIQRAMQRELAQQGVPLVLNMQWNFHMPSYTPHMGGCWERLVRSVKTSLKAILKERAPREDTLLTALITAESIVNSRPLTYVSLEHRDEPCLTPNNFLQITPSGVRDPTELAESSINIRKQWHHAQEIAQHFKRRWVIEYLPTLARRTKWFEKVKQIEMNDIVIICDGQHRGNDWRRGVVTEVVEGAGNQVRAAFVRTADGKVKKYPAVRLAVIDVKVG